MVCFVWEMLLPPMVDLGSCFAVPRSDLLWMVTAPGRAFLAASPFASPPLLFLSFAWGLVWFGLFGVCFFRGN